MLANVPDMYHVRRHQLSPQSTNKKPLTARFSLGFNPTQQCSRIVTHNAAIEKRLALVNCSHNGQYRIPHNATLTMTYKDKSPGRLPVIVGQVPDEVAHDTADDQTAKQLEEAYSMEWDSRIVRRRGLCAMIEWLEHGGRVAG